MNTTQPKNINPVWWEKTVEYSFVIKSVKEKGLDFAAPLSGLQEIVGDGVFSSDAKLVLIEFKRAISDLKSEKDKFICYEQAKEKMINRDKHHFFVFGALEDFGSSILSIKAKHYFSLKDVEPVLSTLEMGLDNKSFKEYLTDLIKLKKVDGRSDGTVGPESISSVVGVSSGKVSSISLTEYVKNAIPELYRELIPTQTPPSPPNFSRSFK
ncbi:MAG: hypothetical protein ACI88H_004299 [Cocleimonas sp.]|jgi:hypothetical protein